MKFCTFSHPARGPGINGLGRPGVLTGDGAMIVDLGDSFPSILAIIQGGDAALARVRDLHARAEIRVTLADAKLHATVPVPEQIRDSMLFEKHVFQARKTMIRMRHPVLAPLMIRMGAAKGPGSWYRMPNYYKSNRFR